VTTLHVHLDESGDFNFSPTGSRYYIFACAWTYEPAPMANELAALRFSLVKQGHGERLSGFHACEDPQLRRDRVLEILTRHKTWNFAAIVLTKKRINPSLYEPEKFYPKFATVLLKFVFAEGSSRKPLPYSFILTHYPLREAGLGQLRLPLS
jgi:hypothetical protein